MKYFFYTLLILPFLFSPACAQYAPQAGLTGSMAISASSTDFVAWATHCDVQRGYECIDTPSLGYASSGEVDNAIGSADGTIVSLGDSGVAVLTFAHPIYNGDGADFAVFENGFSDPADASLAFLELAFVEVSSDGVNYFRFPANSLTQDTTQISNADYMDASRLNNLAGKYKVNYGTPFDLHDLAGISGLDVNNITHIRLIDVIGSISSHASLDSAGRKINDPFPTAFPSSGFDLDAVGVIHQSAGEGIASLPNITADVYPNPVSNELVINVTSRPQVYTAVITDVTGKILYSGILQESSAHIAVSTFSPGIYFLTLCDTDGGKWVRKITKL